MPSAAVGQKDWLDIQAVIAVAHPAWTTGGSAGRQLRRLHDELGRRPLPDFKAAITDRCVSNMVSMMGSSDIIEEQNKYWPGEFWNKPDQLWEMSPIASFGKVRTPMLIIHSEGDLRCNIEQSEQVYVALKLRGIPARFVRYPSNTSHGMSRIGPPDMRLHRLGQITEWWKKYLAR
jgi:acylaminoacyl-peptidase